MHGARGGPKTKKGRIACKMAPMKHGVFSQEDIKERQLVKSLLA